ncbi:MAG: peptide chain release factor N(5)-glutamine methyltransferase [Dysgonamonadaceae bacterium]|jgi:release factor glutamine methyltransferase|nr:peptide chain release factor N(5)-glutamine methyltransferase [Dysgonamonadaceae bacterium]
MQQSLQYMREQLQGCYPDAEIRSLYYRILESVCRADRQTLLRDKDKQLSGNDRMQIRKITEELKNFRPLQYVLGETEFYGLPFRVNEAVLIPRPETEELVEQVLKKDGRRATGDGYRALDIGTGSGCIAITLAKYLPAAEVYALDISEKALAVAAQNAYLNKVNVRFFRHDILSSAPLPFSSFDTIVSNPPYITPSEQPAMSPNVLAYEPHEALFAPEEQPLLFYERIADAGRELLKPDGRIFFEINARFGTAAVEMLRKKNYRDVEVLRDMAGKERIVTGKFPLSKIFVPLHPVKGIENVQDK